MRKANGLFVSTIMMVVLLIVALSTATYAWFSASNVVNIATISFVAKSRTEGDGATQGGAIRLSWQENSAEENLQSEISIANGSSMAPMIPKNQPIYGTTTYEQFVAADNFFTAVQTDYGDGRVYATGPIAATPYTCANPSDGTDTTFYVYNTSEFDMTVTISYGMAGDNSSALRVAFFLDGVLRGIMTKESISYGPIVKNTSVDAQTGIENESAITFALPGNSSSSVKLVAWYDGKFLNDEGALRAAELQDFSFTGAYVAG